MTQCQSYPHFIYQLFAKFLLFVAVLSVINVNQSHSFRVFLALAANENFEVKSLDVTSASLQEFPLKRDVITC